jgi:lipid A 3-O-deacylase
MAVTGPAYAQSTTPAADPASIVTVDVENDAVAGTDRDYSSGLRVNYVSPTGDLPDFVARAGHVLWGNGQQRISIGLSQSIFTPYDTQIDPPLPFQRPYAATLTANFALIQDTQDYRSVLGLDLGMVGPAALGREVQNGFHELIGDTPNRGWAYQIHNEPLGEITSERTYRVSMGNLAGLETDILPELTIGLGNERVYAQTGGLVRIGQGLTTDFGASRIRPGLTGSDAYTPSRGFVWYLFAGIDGQAVGHDITLDGNTAESSAHVTRTPFVGEAEGGVAVVAYGVKLTYTEVVQTHEYRDQYSGLFQFGAVTLSTRF